MYDTGQGVPQDYVQAHTWINLAASRATTGEAKYRLARDSLAERMTASQVAEAQRLAREWQPKTWEQLTGK
jgi:TPR repeat protein